MFPLRDLNETDGRHPVIRTVVWINWLVFVYQYLLAGPHGAEAVVMEYGLVPHDFTRTLATFGLAGSGLVPLVTYMFLHGGLLHIAGNLWFLTVFGDNVEHAVGSRRFALFYLWGGVAAGLAQWAIDPSSSVPMVGASGAVAAVMGAYVVLFPGALVLALLPPIFFVPLPAVLFIGLWFAGQVAASLGDLAGVGGNVAWWAHVGGFVAGALYVWPDRRAYLAALRRTRGRGYA